MQSLYEILNDKSNLNQPVAFCSETGEGKTQVYSGHSNWIGPLIVFGILPDWRITLSRLGFTLLVALLLRNILKSCLARSSWSGRTGLSPPTHSSKG